MINKLFVGLILLLTISTSYAVRFQSYTNDQGETVYSNVPRDCVRNSVLICDNLNPVMSDTKTNKTQPSQPKVQAQAVREETSTTKEAKTVKQNASEANNQSHTLDLLNLLDRVVEMNDIVDQYFPGKPDPDQASSVREQQDEVLDVLEVIKDMAQGEEQETIGEVIDQFRNRLAN